MFHMERRSRNILIIIIIIKKFPRKKSVCCFFGIPLISSTILFIYLFVYLFISLLISVCMFLCLLACLLIYFAAVVLCFISVCNDNGAISDEPIKMIIMKPIKMIVDEYKSTHKTRSIQCNMSLLL